MQQPDPDGHLDRLAARMDAELRAEQAEYESMALQAQWRARSLADVARELMVRGDEVEVVTAGRTLLGTVHHAGIDFMVVSTPAGPTDVGLATMTTFRVVRRARSGGRPPGPGARTLRARMTEHATARTPLTILVADGGTLGATIGAAAEDHLLVQTRRGSVAVPWSAVAAAWPVG